MSRNRFHAGIFFILAFSGILSAQDLLTLEEAIRIGLEKNLDISVARTEARISDNAVHIGKAGFLPKLDITSSTSRSETDSKFHYSDGSPVEETNEVNRALSGGAALNWTVFDGWAMFVNYRKLRQSRDIGRLNLRAEIENTIADIVDFYCEIAKQEHLLRVLRESVAISEERVRLAENNLKLGSGSRFDMLRAKVDMNADQSACLKQEIAVRNAKISLGRLIGLPIDSPFSVEDSLGIRPTLNADSLKRNLLQHNTSLRIAQRNRNLAKLGVTGAASKWYPKLGVYGNYGYGLSRPVPGDFRKGENLTLSYGATLSFNFFNGFSDWIDLQNAKLSVRMSEIKLEDQRRILEASLQQEYNAYVQFLDLMRIEQDNLEIARQTLDIARERFRVGSYTALEMREAQNAYISAETRMVNANYAVKAAENELLRLTGEYVREP